MSLIEYEQLDVLQRVSRCFNIVRDHLGSSEDESRLTPDRISLRCGDLTGEMATDLIREMVSEGVVVLDDQGSCGCEDYGFAVICESSLRDEYRYYCFSQAGWKHDKRIRGRRFLCDPRLIFAFF